jgi:ubiquinone/menaquinone biosynthesis C-methylase UbiE
MTLQFKTDFLENLLREAPLALGIERSWECRILSRQVFESPVLDIGCGDGLFTSVLFADPVDLGVDLNSAEVKDARRRHAYTEVICCSAQSIPRPDQSFRTVFSNSVLEHILPLDEVLKEARRLLMPGGRFFVTVPSHQFERYSAGCRILNACGLRRPANAYGRFYNRFWKHYHFYTPEGWRAKFQAAGFEVMTMREYGPKSGCTLNDVLAFSAFPSVFTKALLGRWILFPALRRKMAPQFSRLFGSVEPSHVKDGGLLFFCLGIPPASK